jgi:hypothetical protein
MARELGMNPKKLGKIDNHRQEGWKRPLPEFIEHLYFKRFGRTAPAEVLSIEDRERRKKAREAAKREARNRPQAPPAGAPAAGAEHPDEEEVPAELANREPATGNGQ